MKTILLTTALTLLSVTAFTQTKTISSEPFTKINVLSSSKITLQNDTSYSISSEDDMNSRNVSVNDGILTIKGSEKDFVVRLPKLNEVVLDGEGTIKGSGTFKTDNLRLQINGGGKIELNVEAAKVNGEINGLGKIVLSGTAQEANFSIPGAGKIDAIEMKTIVCNATISGLGKCMVDVIDVLNANISGNGTIVYRNAPKELNKNVTGLGTIKSLEGSKDSSSPESTGKPDTTKIDFDNKQLWIIGEKNEEEKKRKKSSVRPIWAGFEYGLNTYMDDGGTFTLDPGKENYEVHLEKSDYVSLNLFQQHVELGKSNIWLLSGLGVTWNNYRFDSDIILDNDDYTNAYRDTSGVGHVKSKLVACYVTAPVMLQYFTSRKMKNAFHIGIGGMFGLRLDSYTKRKFEENDMTTKVHSHDDFNLNTFRYGFRVAMGYGKFNVFADYYASTMFKENKGPVLYPFSFGVTVVGW